jgi:hypothetical protein
MITTLSCLVYSLFGSLITLAVYYLSKDDSMREVAPKLAYVIAAAVGTIGTDHP